MFAHAYGGEGALTDIFKRELPPVDIGQFLQALFQALPSEKVSLMPS